MLGESLQEEQRRERGRFANRLFAGTWTDAATRRHDGYARNRFAWLLDRMTPPPELPTIGRKLEILTWWTLRCFTALQRAKARLAAEGAAVSV